MARDLRDELKQAKPFGSLAEEASLSIARTAAVLEHLFLQTLKPHGLTPTQYNVLRILRGAGPDGLCRNEVGARLIRPVPDVTRLLDRMEEQKLITRHRGADRRFVTTRITNKGLELLERLDGEVLEGHERVLGHLGRRRLRELIDLLGVAREAT